MDEDTVTTTPEPAPDPAPAPEPPPPEPEPTPEPADPVTVVSVDELIDRLVQSTEPGEEVPPDEGSTQESIVEEPAPAPEPLEIVGMDKLLTCAETIQQTLDHPALTTSFRDYTVTEGLLLLILLAAFAAACIKILKGGFSWLRW